ncbi:MAG: hypothetical protein IKA17_08605 [Clostridia bacterium]|nr:hypothetical protein [Clostridia bacterium]
MNQRQMFVKTTKDNVLVYVSSPKADDGCYVEYCLRHLVKPYTDGGTYQNQDLWRLYELYTYKEEENAIIKDKPYCIINWGEWECALEIKDTPDFHGGFHGYEHLTKIVTKLDGKDFDFEKETDLTEAKKFEFIHYSNIYRQGTKDELVAEHVKHYTFENGYLSLKQELVWHQKVTILFAYLAMLPIRRTSDDTPAGEQLTDRVKIDKFDEIFDITKEGHNTKVSMQHEKELQNVSYAKIWGEKSGFTAEMTINCDYLPTNTFAVQNADCYNKLYFSYAGGGVGHTVKIGEKWQLETKYEIYKKLK